MREYRKCTHCAESFDNDHHCRIINTIIAFVDLGKTETEFTVTQNDRLAQENEKKYGTEVKPTPKPNLDLSSLL